MRTQSGQMAPSPQPIETNMGIAPIRGHIFFCIVGQGRQWILRKNLLVQAFAGIRLNKDVIVTVMNQWILVLGSLNTMRSDTVSHAPSQNLGIVFIMI